MARQISTSTTPQKGANPAVIVVTLILMALAFSCGFGALTVQADLTQPVAAAGAPAQDFVVHGGDTINVIGTNLENQRLIRSALFFKLYLKIKGLTPNVEPGTYQISPSYSISRILQVFAAGAPQPFVRIQIQEGLRASQYADAIIASATDEKGNHTTLPNFSAADFNSYAIQGKGFVGGAAYWFVSPWKMPPAKAALEGYLAPNTYYVDPGSDALTIIKTLLNTFGEQLCPGTASDPTAYIFDQTACKAHQATITLPTGVPGAGTTMGVFDALAKYYKGNLQNALIIASIAQREARTTKNFYLVASTYYNRWSQVNNPYTVGDLGADPTSQYSIGTNVKAGANPWAPLPASPSSMPASDPYNTYLNKGLPPSAISGPGQDALYGAIFPPTTSYVYFFYACNGNNYYESNPTDFQNDENKYGVGQPGACSNGN